MFLQRGFNRIRILIKALLQLPKRELFHYACYLVGMKSGFYRFQSSLSLKNPIPSQLIISPNMFVLPDLENFLVPYVNEKKNIIDEANVICNGKVHLFGGPAVVNTVTQTVSQEPWWKIESQIHSNPEYDPKFTWEPARFGWTFILMRAYRLTGDQRYADYFWQTAFQFMAQNSPFSGPNWTSGQEVALRLIAFLSAFQVFGKPNDPSLDWKAWLSYVVYHARRIPITFRYALAQNNNHLISEALGLFLAGCAFKNLPEALTWKKMGWHWLCWAFTHQIEEDGAYPQQSTNYHRLVLQAGLLAISMAKKEVTEIPEIVEKKFLDATRWLMEYIDPESGMVPNLGPNDGAYILPLSSGGFEDYRSTVQAALRMAGQAPMFPAGPWDELSLWLGLGSCTIEQPLSRPQVKVHPRITTERSWISVRSRRFVTRPGHADLLHVDLWWKGHAVTLDAGTYRYSAASPWNNSLARSIVHNSVTVEGKDQMLRAGRFLWLDWADSTFSINKSQIHTWHNGYRNLGIRHDRMITTPMNNRYYVDDLLVGSKAAVFAPAVYLHWLLPDWEFKLDSRTIRIYPPFTGRITLDIQSLNPSTQVESITLFRAGEVICGNKNLQNPTLGWHSSTYSVKLPALSVCAEIRGSFPLQFRSDWRLEEIE